MLLDRGIVSERNHLASTSWHLVLASLLEDQVGVVGVENLEGGPVGADADLVRRAGEVLHASPARFESISRTIRTITSVETQPGQAAPEIFRTAARITRIIAGRRDGPVTPRVTNT
jgi:hypothetical protein